MMPDRKMFWRMIRRLLAANRGRLFVILLALGAGAAITAALLNLEVDAKRRLTAEFRTLGANVVIAPAGSGTSVEPPRFLYDSLFADLSAGMDSSSIPKAAFLYGIIDAAKSKVPVTKTKKLGQVPRLFSLALNIREAIRNRWFHLRCWLRHGRTNPANRLLVRR